MALYKCQMCGGELVKNQDGTYECLYCGTIQSVENIARTVENPIAPSASAIDNVYKSAINAMAAGKYENAIKMFSVVIDYRDSSEKINLCKEALKKETFETIYTNACNIQVVAKTEKEFRNASVLFDRIAEYKDSSALKIQCETTADMLHKEGIYVKACKLMEEDSLAFVEQSIQLFDSIGEYKDSESKIQECTKKHETLEKEIESHTLLVNEARKKLQNNENKKKRKRKTIVLIIFVIITLFIACIIISKKATHSINNIKIEMIDSTSKHDSRYYYVYMDFKINNNTGNTIDYLNVTTFFTDKNGKSIGTMTSEYGSLYGDVTLNLKSKESTIKETYLSEYQSSSSYGTLFTELYNDGIDNLVIIHEITYVKWSDGVTYKR